MVNVPVQGGRQREVAQCPDGMQVRILPDPFGWSEVMFNIIANLFCWLNVAWMFLRNQFEPWE